MPSVRRQSSMGYRGAAEPCGCAAAQESVFVYN
jgi:hypothetical protein